MSKPAIQQPAGGAFQEWLLAILRFAVTLAPNDRAAVLAMATELDRPQDKASKFSFFSKTSIELCNAIALDGGPEGRAVLRAHLVRIDDRRLRRALEAALDRDLGKVSPPPRKNVDQAWLWRGLPDAEHLAGGAHASRQKAD